MLKRETSVSWLATPPPPTHPADFPPHQIKLEAKGVELFSFFFQTFHAVSLNQKEKVNESAARGIGRYCAHSTIPSSCRGERERAGVGRISQRESLIDPLGRRGRHKRKTKRPERDRDCARGAGETCDEWIGSALTLRPAVSHTRGSTCVHLCSVVSSSPPGCRYLFRVCTGSGACALPLVDGPRPKATSVSSFSAAPPALLPHRSPRRRRCFVVRSCVCVCVCVCGIFSLPFLSIYYYRTSVSGHFPLASSLFSGSSLFFFVFDESAPAPTGHPPPVFFCSATRGPTGAPAPNKSRTRGETTGDSTEFRFLRSHSLLLHYNDDTHYHHRSAVSTRRRKQVESLFFSSSLVHKGIADCGDRFEDSLLAHCLTVCHRSESTVG